MTYDTIYLNNDSGIAFIQSEIQKYFNEKLEFKSVNSCFEHHGWFLLEYFYPPKQYEITIESEFNVFSIDIRNEDGGFISLIQLHKFNNNSTRKNMTAAMKALQSVLDQEIAFYKSVDGKLYQQVDGKYKRIKDWANHAEQPNKETRAAMLEAERIVRDPSAKRYSEVEDALRTLKE